MNMLECVGICRDYVETCGILSKSFGIFRNMPEHEETCGKVGNILECVEIYDNILNT